MTYIVAFLVAAVGVWWFFKAYPPFGGRTSVRIKQKSANFSGGRFVNQIPTPMDMGLKDTLTILREFMRNDPKRRPSKLLLPEPLDTSVSIPAHKTRLTWFGHSAFLLQANGKNILLDPMFGVSPSPFPGLTSKRFSDQLPAMPEDLPHIDAVVVSHDHYDHLDYPSIKKIRTKVDMFYVPIGLGAHLQRWGVKKTQITELDWWDKRTLDGFTFVCTPSRHFSGRTLTDRFATLWASWVIDTGDHRLFFSGDSGYGPHFAQIGKEYGPFDMTLLECGQYDRRWPNIHMTPEQTVEAHKDLRGKRMIPMHWGAFVLALHSWTEPVERVLKAAKKEHVHIVTPKIGEPVIVGSALYPAAQWWRNL